MVVGLYVSILPSKAQKAWSESMFQMIKLPKAKEQSEKDENLPAKETETSLQKKICVYLTKPYSFQTKMPKRR